MLNTQMRFGKPLAALACTILWLAPATGAEPAARYEIRLDERAPQAFEVDLVLSTPAARALTLVPGTEASLIREPRCGNAALKRLGSGAWLKPENCRRVSWSARLASLDAAGTDATRPPAGWSARHRFWLLTGDLPLLRADASEAPARVKARLAGGGSADRRLTLPRTGGVPLAVVLAARAPLRFRHGGLEMLLHGSAPAAARDENLQQQVVAAWSRWRRDILPDSHRAPRSLSVAWLDPPPGAEPGFFASSASDAILMQHVHDPAASLQENEAKLQAGVLLIGAHEGFHSLAAAIPGLRPAWVNESWASYFAWEAARRHLTGASLEHATSLIETPAPIPILAAQRLADAGDASQTLVFYSKGARFWTALEAVLDGPANGSGRLAALIKKSRGMQGVDWQSADSVAAWLDARSSGRAGPIVRCYLVGEGCAAP